MAILKQTINVDEHAEGVREDEPLFTADGNVN
jgi:hypothetical protein